MASILKTLADGIFSLGKDDTVGEESWSRRDHAEPPHSRRTSSSKPSTLPLQSELALPISQPRGPIIRDNYPDPLRSFQAANATTRRHPKEFKASADEQRLLGSYKVPSDRTIIDIPGREEDIVVKKMKPGTTTAFKPRDNIHGERFSSGPSEMVTSGRYTGIATPRQLHVQVSRGSNVPYGEDEFPDRQHTSKRLKLDHYSVAPRSRVQTQTIDISDDDSQTLDSTLRRVQPLSSQSASGILTRPAVRVHSQNLFGLSEFHGVEDRASRRRLSEKKSSYFPQRAQQTTLGEEKRAPRVEKPREVIDLESATPQGSQISDLLSGLQEAADGCVEVDDDIEITKEHTRQGLSTSFLPPLPNFTAPSRSAVSSAEGGQIGSRATIPLSSVTVLELEDDTTRVAENVIKRSRDEAPLEIDSSIDELALENDQPSAKRQKSPTKSTSRQYNARPKDSEADDPDYDPLNIRPSFKRHRSGKTILNDEAQRRAGKYSDDVGAVKNEFPVQEVCTPRGDRLNDSEAMLLYFNKISEPHLVKLKSLRDGQPLHNTYQINLKQVNKYLWSPDQSPLIRLEMVGGYLHDIHFVDHNAVRGFSPTVKNYAPQGAEHTKEADWMLKIYGNRNSRRLPPPEADGPVDAGAEEALLQARLSNDQLAQRSSNTIRNTQARHRQPGLLRSQQKVEGIETPSAKRSRVSPGPIRYEGDSELDEIFRVPTPRITRTQPIRMTRATRSTIKLSPTPEAEPQRYSEKHGLGMPWDQPVIYPEAGKKKATVEFEDLKKLDEGEFINDSLIEFYFRWLQEQFPSEDCTVYFLSTHFYTKLIDVPRGQKGSINYKAVERWVKDDIFNYDFVVVPINESMHWYVAIICNLPNVERKFVGKAVDAAPLDADGTSSQPVQVGDGVNIDRSANARSIRADEAMRDLKLNSTPPPQQPTSIDHKQTVFSDVDEDAKATGLLMTANGTIANDLDIEKLKTSDETETVGSYSVASQGTDSGIFSHAIQASPERRRIKRKSGPPPKKYNPDSPIVVVLDSLHGSHSRSLSNLKGYLVEEAREKRQMELDKTDLQGFHARVGLPAQENYSDCGLFVCGYIHKFMQDPHAFGKKLLAQEFDRDSDWPEMAPSKMRNDLRAHLMAIAQEQKENREMKKAEKRRKKLEAGRSTSGPPTSPVKACAAQFDGAVSSPVPTEAEINATKAHPEDPERTKIPGRKRDAPRTRAATSEPDLDMLMKPPPAPIEDQDTRGGGAEEFFKGLQEEASKASQQDLGEIRDSQPGSFEAQNPDEADTITTQTIVQDQRGSQAAPFEIHEDYPAASTEDRAVINADVEVDGAISSTQDQTNPRNIIRESPRPKSA